MRHPKRSAVVLCSLLAGVLVGGAFAAAVFSSPAPAWAQADNAANDADASGEELALEMPVDAATPPADAEESPPEEKSYLQWMAESLGVSYSIVFLAISFTLVSLLVMNILTARRESLLPTALVENFESLLNEEKYQEAYERAKSDESMLGQVLSAGLAKLSRGYNEAIEAMQETGEEENMKLEHRLSYIALIGTVSPMIGLLGTVQGMIASFQVIATSATAPKAAQLAEGIATALFTTLVGLMIAIPAIAAYNILRNRIARLVLEVGILSEDLMSRFSNVGAKK
ncbi:MAG: MotA/TolQ/ExbB proton channel family protein [Pirellulales bacterium]|nr:MotA/TolQ/ExbB proton channel family protein [Pirellulales bacterium]